MCQGNATDGAAEEGEEEAAEEAPNVAHLAQKRVTHLAQVVPTATVVGRAQAHGSPRTAQPAGMQSPLQVSRVFICMCVCMYVCVRVCMCMCVVCVYTHTPVYICTPRSCLCRSRVCSHQVTCAPRRLVCAESSACACLCAAFSMCDTCACVCAWGWGEMGTVRWKAEA